MRPATPTLVLTVLAIAVGLTVVAGAATSTAAFDSFNQDWDGTSDLQSIATEEGSDTVFIRNTTEYQAHGTGDVAFVLAPETRYREGETKRVERFVERGGTLVVASENGSHTTSLLEAIGADARPVGPTLRDEREFYRGPALPVADNVSSHSLVTGVESVTLNHGTAVDPNGAAVLVTSSPYSYLDTDGSASRSGDETVQSYPVATVEPLGDGRVVVVGDASVFINVMNDRGGNEPFVRSLVADTDHTMIDVSRSRLPPLVAAVLTIRDSQTIKLGLGLGGIVVLVGGSSVWARRRTNVARTLDGIDRDTLAAGLQKRYPELDRDRLVKVTKGVKPNNANREDDE